MGVKYSRIAEMGFYEALLASVGTDTLDVLPEECSIFYGFPTIQKVTGITHQTASELEASRKQLAELQKNVILQDTSLRSFFFPARPFPNVDGRFRLLFIPTDPKQ